MIKTEKISDFILWARVDRPDARNAINFQVIDQLESIVDKLEEDDSEIRVFIFSGTGSKSFIAGGDLKEFHSITEENDAIKMSHRMQDLLNRIEQLPCWTLAFINGDAYGGGIEMMLAFDFILAASHSKFGFTQGRFYLTPGWGGLTRLIEKVGRSKALEWQGKAEVKKASVLISQNFLNAIVEEDNVIDWTKDLIHNDRDFIQTLKNSATDTSSIRLKRMRGEVEPFAKLWVHDNHTSRVESFMHKKKDHKS
jgi:enoyl-CoA hydratase/carnithine racemase